ncbi:MAG TPA: hypothetical protein VFB37_00890, partial [Steroidobacteraceae bacterium]|nr:hypothetical protein [Steroidobacteraceae bacterium]
IPWGGSQRLVVHEQIGGARVLDAMGRSDRALEWSGLFSGPDASQRAQFLDSLRVSGAQQSLTWAQFSYLVVVREFTATYQRFYRIPYHIVCEVVLDQSKPVTSAPPTAVDDALLDDQAAADALAGAIGDGLLSSLMSGLDTAIAAVSTFANAAQSTINSVLQPLAAVQARVSTLIGISSNALANVTTFGGVLPGTPPALVAGKLTDQTVNMVQATNLFQMRNLLGRMDANLIAINVPQKTVATAGGNLFRIAQNQYGDAIAWTALARANGLTDPFVQGSALLAVPPSPDKLGGVLNA